MSTNVNIACFKAKHATNGQSLQHFTSSLASGRFRLIFHQLCTGRTSRRYIIFGDCCGLSKKYTQIIQWSTSLSSCSSLCEPWLCQFCVNSVHVANHCVLFGPTCPANSFWTRCRRSGCAVETICFHQLQQIPEPRVRATNIDYPVLGPLQDCKT